MRHGDKIKNLSRKKAHRDALLSNLACQLITHKRITTTVAKAKALRTYVEPLITKGKTNTTHQRRVVFSYLQDKDAITELFSAVAEKIAGRPGGYTRIIKLGARPGDNAEQAMIELVDFNEIYGKGKEERKEGAKEQDVAVEVQKRLRELKQQRKKQQQRLKNKRASQRFESLAIFLMYQKRFLFI
jgi:large subunit ribosomal protein L17